MYIHQPDGVLEVLSSRLIPAASLASLGALC
jgi:hypothetical protein